MDYDVVALRDGEHDSFIAYADAVAYVDTLTDEWEARTGLIADRSWASPDNMYCAKCGDNGAIYVVRGED